MSSPVRLLLLITSCSLLIVAPAQDNCLRCCIIGLQAVVVQPNFTIVAAEPLCPDKSNEQPSDLCTSIHNICKNISQIESWNSSLCASETPVNISLPWKCNNTECENSNLFSNLSNTDLCKTSLSDWSQCYEAICKHCSGKCDVQKPDCNYTEFEDVEEHTPRPHHVTSTELTNFKLSELCSEVIHLCGNNLFENGDNIETRCKKCCNSSKTKIDSSGGEACGKNKTNYSCQCEDIPTGSTTQDPGNSICTDLALCYGSFEGRSTGICDSLCSRCCEVFMAMGYPSPLEGHEDCFQTTCSTAVHSSPYCNCTDYPILSTTTKNPSTRTLFIYGAVGGGTTVILVLVAFVVACRRYRMLRLSEKEKSQSSRTVHADPVQLNGNIEHSVTTATNEYDEIQLSNMTKPQNVSKKTKSVVNKQGQCKPKTDRILCNTKNNNTEARIICQPGGNEYDTIILTDQIESSDKTTDSTAEPECTESHYCALKHVNDKHRKDYEVIQVNLNSETEVSPSMKSYLRSSVTRTGSNVRECKTPRTSAESKELGNANNICDHEYHVLEKTDTTEGLRMEGNDLKTPQEVGQGSQTYFILEQRESVRSTNEGNSNKQCKNNTCINETAGQNEYYILEQIPNKDHVGDIQFNDTEARVTETVDEKEYYILEPSTKADLVDNTHANGTEACVSDIEGERESNVLEQNSHADLNQPGLLDDTQLGQNKLGDYSNEQKYFVLEKGDDSECTGESMVDTFAVDPQACFMREQENNISNI